MSLLRINQLSIAFGIHRLLDDANLVIQRGERIGLLGRNGEGKSTLLKIISGELPFDEGDIQGRDQIKIAMLDQAPNLNKQESIYKIVATGLGDIGTIIGEFQHLSQHAETDADLATLGDLQAKIDAENAWPLMNNIDRTLSKLGLEADTLVSSLSGGWQRRVSLARALVIEPDLLLLDEPTNHLDLEAIAWLETQLVQLSSALLFVTHDRAFLQKIATRIVDLDRGQLVSWPGTYNDYLRRKAASLEEESRRNAEFDKKLAQEEKWIRQGIKARRTRNEGRVRALKKMRDDRAQRRNQQGQVKLNLSNDSRSGKRIIEARHISFSFPDKTIVKDLSINVRREDRIGIIGPNGVGKTTLIKLLLGELQADSGSLKLGTNIQVAYFDQLRGQLDPKKTIAEFIGEGRDEIEIGGRTRHVISYLSDFLFAPARARTPIGSLSGGERARVLLAWLFSKPVNFLVMDEPTNDLDIETLELLEEVLLEFKGTLLLVSHDRVFMDNVITSTLVMQANGEVEEFVGGYSDAMRQLEMAKGRGAGAEKEMALAQSINAKKLIGSADTKVSKAPSANKKKLSYKDQTELNALPAKIDALETKQAGLVAALSKPDLYQTEPETARTLNEQLQSLSVQLDTLVERWTELEQ